MRQFYYKMRLLKNATFITNCDSTHKTKTKKKHIICFDLYKNSMSPCNLLFPVKCAICYYALIIY